jgi:hypothetical protein
MAQILDQVRAHRTVPPPWPSGVSWRPERLRPAPFAGRFRFV